MRRSFSYFFFTLFLEFYFSVSFLLFSIAKVGTLFSSFYLKKSKIGTIRERVIVRSVVSLGLGFNESVLGLVL